MWKPSSAPDLGFRAQNGGLGQKALPLQASVVVLGGRGLGGMGVGQRGVGVGAAIGKQTVPFPSSAKSPWPLAKKSVAIGKFGQKPVANGRGCFCQWPRPPLRFKYTCEREGLQFRGLISGRFVWWARVRMAAPACCFALKWFTFGFLLKVLGCALRCRLANPRPRPQRVQGP